MRLLILLLISQMAMSQTLITQDGDYIEVPEGKRAVFIKKEMPLEHCGVICTSPVEEPTPKDTDVVYCDEEQGLVVSPSYCVPRPD